MPEVGEGVAVDIPDGGADNPLVKVVRGRVVTMTFRSDHLDAAGKKLLKPSPGGLMDAVATYEKPDWAIGKSDPISQTKDTKIKVDVGIRFVVTPEGETGRVTKLIGESEAGDYFCFEAAANQNVGTQTVQFAGFESKGSLPNMVTLVAGDIKWTAEIDGQIVELGSTGQHRVMVTFGVPGGKMSCPVNNRFTETGPDQDVTTARLLWAINAANGKGGGDEKECVDSVFKRLMRLGVGYALGYRWVLDRNSTGMDPKPTLHHYLWACNNHTAQGECHNIAAAFVLACRILGVTKPFAIGVMYPWASRDDTIVPDYPKSKRVSPTGKAILGKYNVRYERQHVSEKHGFEYLVFLDGAGAANNFEGVAKYGDTALYAIGDDIFDQFPDITDNASSYYAMRDISDAIRRPITDMNKGWADLRFVTLANGCQKPYPWSKSPKFKWHE